MSVRRRGRCSQLPGESSSGPSPRSRRLSPLGLASSPGSLKRACLCRLVLSALATVRTSNKTRGRVHSSSQTRAREEGETHRQPETEPRPCNCHKVVAISQQLSGFSARLPAPCSVLSRARTDSENQGGPAAAEVRAAGLTWTLRAWAGYPGPTALGRRPWGTHRLRSPHAACALRGHGRRSSSGARPPSQAAVCGARPSHGLISEEGQANLNLRKGKVILKNQGALK